MVSSDEEKLEVTVRVPGSQNFTFEQRTAVRDLVDGLKADGYDVSWPLTKTASTGQAIVDIVCLYMATRGSLRIVNRITDDTADFVVDSAEKLLGKGVDWAREQFRKNPRAEGEPPRTQKIVIFGPDGEPLREIEVAENDEDTDGASA